jgi:hypothetical protein
MPFLFRLARIADDLGDARVIGLVLGLERWWNLSFLGAMDFVLDI